MILEKVRIRNYRSLEDFEFKIESLSDNSSSFGLIGVNEAGKSSILTALALKDGVVNSSGERLPLIKDFNNKESAIQIDYYYELTKPELDKAKLLLNEGVTEEEKVEIDFSRFMVKTFFNPSAPSTAGYQLKIHEIKDRTKAEVIEKKLLDFAKSTMQVSVFWTAESRFLISAPIPLGDFAANPEAVSIPLKNSFFLAGIDNIEAAINKLIGDSTEVEYLQEQLGEAVTKHISSRWPGHPIKITFTITDGKINFHVRDTKTKAKAKTADQRSDGFKQFVSFLLTISAQNINKELSDTILLLDEPETHLHPKAQENLLQELIKISNKDNNNIVMFATHSIFMIDRGDLSRNYEIFKERAVTDKKRFDKKTSTYSSVTYEVFEIVSTDYHNELYSQLHARYQDADPADSNREGVKNFDNNYFHAEKKIPKNKPWKKKANECTLPTYIRNCIHHSDNGDAYTPEELKESIERMSSLL
jgi:AAA15 family ATPase/GTPase